ncbi:MAG TPA: hypothetical protein VGX23_07340 [Actinocrinis sp.]|nr:hypothetical protein [Actinocrinis sp.]
MVADGTYRIRSQAGLLTDFDDLLVVLGDGGDGQLWTVANQEDATFTIKSNLGNYLSLAHPHGPYYTPTTRPALWTTDDRGSLIESTTDDILAMSLIRIFPSPLVKTTDGPTMPLLWSFQSVQVASVSSAG